MLLCDQSIKLCLWVAAEDEHWSIRFCCSNNFRQIATLLKNEIAEKVWRRLCVTPSPLLRHCVTLTRHHIVTSSTIVVSFNCQRRSFLRCFVTASLCLVDTASLRHVDTAVDEDRFRNENQVKKKFLKLRYLWSVSVGCLTGCHDIQHDDTHQNGLGDTQYNNTHLIIECHYAETIVSYATTIVVMLSVKFSYSYTECQIFLILIVMLSVVEPL
jgi:hypothetical protein